MTLVSGLWERCNQTATYCQQSYRTALGSRPSNPFVRLEVAARTGRLRLGADMGQSHTAAGPEAPNSVAAAAVPVIVAVVVAPLRALTDEQTLRRDQFVTSISASARDKWIEIE